MGKSTVGQLLAELLGCDFVDLDEIGDCHYQEVGQPLGAFLAKIEELGYVRAHAWWQPARAHAVVRVMEDCRGAVVALGAGHSHFEDRAWLDVVQAALQSESVVLLLPDPDPAVAVAALRARSIELKGHSWVIENVDYLANWVASGQNRQLADIMVYVGKDAADAVANKVCDALGGLDAQ